MLLLNFGCRSLGFLKLLLALSFWTRAGCYFYNIVSLWSFKVHFYSYYTGWWMTNWYFVVCVFGIIFSYPCLRLAKHHISWLVWMSWTRAQIYWAKNLNHLSYSSSLVFCPFSFVHVATPLNILKRCQWPRYIKSFLKQLMKLKIVA